MQLVFLRKTARSEKIQIRCGQLIKKNNIKRSILACNDNNQYVQRRTVTGWRCSFMLTKCLVVVSGEMGLHVGHTSVAFCRFRGSFGNYFEELSANVTFDILTEPANISISGKSEAIRSQGHLIVQAIHKYPIRLDVNLTNLF